MNSLINKISFISILLLFGCQSKLILKTINGTQFWDKIVFIGTETIGISYIYKFEQGKYSLLARSTQSGSFENYIVEQGTVTQKKNAIILLPEKKLCFDMGSGNEKKLISYETTGISEDLFFVLKDTLSEKERVDLNFIPRIMNLKNVENEIMLIDENVVWGRYSLMD